MTKAEFIQSMRGFVDQMEKDLPDDEEQDVEGWLTYLEYQMEELDLEFYVE